MKFSLFSHINPMVPEEKSYNLRNIIKENTKSLVGVVVVCIVCYKLYENWGHPMDNNDTLTNNNDHRNINNPTKIIYTPIATAKQEPSPPEDTPKIYNNNSNSSTNNHNHNLNNNSITAEARGIFDGDKIRRRVFPFE